MEANTANHLDLPRRKRLRLPQYDYSASGAYFVTICTHEKVCRLGEVRDGVVGLSEEGLIAAECWNKLADHSPSVVLDEFVIMPNHVHGILWLREPESESPPNGRGGLSPRNPPAGPSLPEVVRYFKTTSAKRIHALIALAGQPFWQRSYYERVIRNDAELYDTRLYIRNNPARWELDGENPSTSRTSGRVART